MNFGLDNWKKKKFFNETFKEKTSERIFGETDNYFYSH